CFPDVQKEWFAPYICYAKDHKWISGFADGKFHPNDKVTRVESIKIIVNGFFNGKIIPEKLENTSINDIKVSEWYGKYFIFADNRDLLDKQHIVKNGSNYAYLPLKNITRKEVAEIIFRIKNLSNGYSNLIWKNTISIDTMRSFLLASKSGHIAEFVLQYKETISQINAEFKSKKYHRTYKEK
ncbi:S-layer homology domain-containing protein, partial [Candidatus Gracilibacteria bacterium]|nr:S-layer homology domain-containing protein [Candidatus Gracilibacteria bacterium]